MTLRSKIVALVQDHSEPSLVAWKILCMLDDEGLGIFGNGFLDHDDEYEKGCNYFGITQIIADVGDVNQAALSTLSRLEFLGLSLLGNGWLDDDDVAAEFVGSDPDAECYDE